MMLACARCNLNASGGESCPKCGGRLERPGPSVATEKMAICRTICPYYDASGDRCGILVARGLPGRVGYLATHPELRCADKERPRF